MVVKAGATQLIAGSSVFKGDVIKNIRILRKRANEAVCETLKVEEN
jgi:pentose-5-phosphate-3-epimerase